MAGIIAAGNLFMGRYENGVFKGYPQEPVNATKFEIKTDGELKTRTSRQIGSYGQVKGSVGIPKPMGVAIEVDDAADAQMLGIALMGTVTSANAATLPTVVTDQNFTVLSLGKYLPIGHRNITNLTVKKADDSVVSPTNYSLYPRANGMIAFSGGVTEGEIVKLSFSHQDDAQTLITPMTQSIVKAKVWLDGENLETGKPFEVEFHEVVFLAKAALDFMNADFMKVALEGTPQTPIGYTSPCKYIKYD